MGWGRDRGEPSRGSQHCSWFFQPDNDSSITDIIFHFTTEELALLPLRDLAVFHDGDALHQFGFTIGPVCFS